MLKRKEEADLDIVCDIDDRANAGDKYEIKANTTENDRLKYKIGRDDHTHPFTSGDDSDTITVSASGTLEITTRLAEEDDAVMAVAVGSKGVENIAVMEIELEAEKEDAQIVDAYLTLPANLGAQDSSAVAVSESTLEKVFDRFTLRLGNTYADPNDYEASVTLNSNDYDNLASNKVLSRAIKFDNVGETIQHGDANKKKFDMTVDFRGIDKNNGSAGQFLQASNLVIIWEGENSGTKNVTEYAIDAGNFATALPFPSVPTVSTTAKTGSLGVSGEQKVYEFTVHADDEGDVYLSKVVFGVTLTNAAASNMKIYRGANNDGTVRGSQNTVTAGDVAVDFNNVEEIEAGSSQTYSVYATVTVSGSDSKAITVEMANDAKESTPMLGRTHTAAKAAGKFVWSPNSLNEDGSTDATNTDWFTGWTVVSDSDTKGWTLERN